MFKKMVVSAVFAGFAAGLIAAALQFVFVQPVLLHAELYETGALVHFGGTGDASGDVGVEHSHEDDHDHAAGTGSDLGRNALSVLFSALIYSGYGLILLAGFALAKAKGIHVRARSGLLWGVAGFVAFHFAPAAGLPPELPGASAAEVFPRQIWWFGTVIATAGGLCLIAFGRRWPAWGMAVVLILGPHVIGAPQPEVFQGPTPPELGGLFAGRALGVGMAAWACLGLFAGYFWNRSAANS